MLVNIGDTLVKWSGNVLRSNLHRVVTPPGEQAAIVRQSMAYLVKTDNAASMKRLKGSGIPGLKDGEVDEERNMIEWATWRAGQIMRGEMKVETMGGEDCGDGDEV